MRQILFGEKQAKRVPGNRPRARCTVNLSQKVEKAKQHAWDAKRPDGRWNREKAGIV